MRWFLDKSRKLWPLAVGSLSLRKSPCIRKNCSACASGKGHSSYALSGYRGNKRFSIYVPDDLAPEIQKAIENGRLLEDLIKEAGIRYLKARKLERRAKKGAKVEEPVTPKCGFEKKIGPPAEVPVLAMPDPEKTRAVVESVA